jgi:hypothetical protein
MAEPMFMKLGMYIMATDPSHQAVSPIIVSRQRLGKSVTAPMNTQATVEELLDALFSVRSVSYERKVSE